MSDLSTAIYLPRCIIGDFNKILFPNKKLGGLTPNNTRSQYLMRFLINGHSLPSVENPFTWKQRIHTHLVYECLDKAITRLDCCAFIRMLTISHGSFICSDHCPITLITDPLMLRTKAFPFRY